jgi:hypothetical protein
MSNCLVVSGAAFSLADGVVVEFVGADALVLVDGRVVRLTGVAAQVVGAVVADGRSVDLGGEDAVAESVGLLCDLGVLTERRAGLSRRRALGVVAGGAALGATVLVLPSAAAAASDAAGPQGTLAPDDEASTTTTTTTVPDAPSGLSFSEPTDDGFTVSWT